jgi:hypothetical protein
MLLLVSLRAAARRFLLCANSCWKGGRAVCISRDYGRRKRSRVSALRTFSLSTCGGRSPLMMPWCVSRSRQFEAQPLKRWPLYPQLKLDRSCTTWRRTNRLPGALEALAVSDPARATPILIDALADDFARDSAAAALRGMGGAVRVLVVDAACEAGERPAATIRKRLAALDLLRDLPCDHDDWRRLERILDDSEPQLVCAASLLGIELSPSPDRIARRLLEILPQVGWEWLSIVEDMIVRCAERAGDRFRPLVPIDAADSQTLAAWRRICRRLGITDR